MDDWNNEHSMVFRCGAAWKESITRRRRSRRSANLSRFRDATIRDAWRGPRIIAGGRRKRAVAGRGTAEASEAKILAKHCRALSSKCARGQTGDFLAFRTYNWDFGSPRAKRPKNWGAVCVRAVNRSFTQVRHHMSWLGKSYLKITQDLLKLLLVS